MTRATARDWAMRAASRRPSLNEAGRVILQAIEKAGYKPGEDVAIALDPASTELSTTTRRLWERRLHATTSQRKAESSGRRDGRLLGGLGQPVSDRVA